MRQYTELILLTMLVEAAYVAPLMGRAGSDEFTDLNRQIAASKTRNLERLRKETLRPESLNGVEK